MRLLTDFKDRAVSARKALPAVLLVLGLAPWGGIVMAQQASMEDRLRTLLAGPNAPDWIVQMNGFNSWGIDDGGRLRSVVEERYDVVARVCGKTMWLRTGLERPLAPEPDC